MSQRGPAHILVVDDEQEVRATVSRYLSSEGFEVQTASSGDEMKKELAKIPVDLVLLDLGLKNESGLDLLKDLAADPSIAVVVLTGKSDPIERVVGLELGADDYFIKPFLNRELLARINAVLRRTRVHRGETTSETPDASSSRPRQLRVNGWLLDTRVRQVQTIDGNKVDLTGTEFELLTALVSNVGETLSRDKLSRMALNRDWSPRDRSVDIHIYNLRRKMEESGGNGDSIVAIRNVGYVLTAQVQQG